MQTNEQILKDGILEALELLKEYGKAVLIQQGHVATNNGINSLDTQIDTLGNEFIGSVTGRHYLLAQDTGVKYPKYPIKVIMDWIEKRGFNIAMTNKNGKLLSPSKQTVKNLAYAIQYTHKFQVNPTGIHSTNRNRDISKQGWIGQTIDAKKQEVFDIR